MAVIDSRVHRARRHFAVPCLAALALFACDTDDLVPNIDAQVEGGSGDPDAGSDPDAGPSMDTVLLDAPAADEVAMLELEEPVSDVVYAEDLPIGLHEESGASILDMSDPSDPEVIATIPTTGRVVSVTIDVQLRILYVLTVSGNLYAYRVSDARNPRMLSQTTITEDGGSADGFQALVRVGQRLFVLGSVSLLPLQIQLGANGSVSLLLEAQIELDEDAEQLLTSGGVLYVVFTGGKIQIWSGGSAPAMLDQGNLGGDVLGIVPRGRKLFVALRGIGLRVVDMSVRGTLRVLFPAQGAVFDDIEGLERFGNLVLVSLARGTLAALDLSDLAAPRPLVTRQGTLPQWIAPIGGNLVLGGDTTLQVFGVPPFVAASLPGPMKASFPRYGKLPLQLSKPIDPRTVTVDNVTLRCGGTTIQGTVSVSLDNLRITFLPSATLPAGATCALGFDGVRDALGLDLTLGSGGMSFTTATAAPGPIMNPGSSYPHTADGAFTDWEPGMTEDFEYFDVQGAQGMYSRFYADFDGEKLWMLNDWFYNGDEIDPDCYNQFGVWTGGGSQRWEIRAYGDQRIEVLLDGTLLAEDDERVVGGYDFAATPNDDEPHTIYEIGITTAPGSWGVQLHDPGPTFSCQQLETDPTNYNGSSTAEMSMIDPTMSPTRPPQPVPSVQLGQTGSPTLSWPIAQGEGAFTSYLIEVSSGSDLSNVFYKIVVYGGQLVVPPGLLQNGMTYTFRVTAYNLAGSVQSDAVTFTVGGEPPNPDAPTIESIEPTSVTVGSAPTLTITGEGFTQNARVYVNGEAVSTTYVSATMLTAMLTEAETSAVGRRDVTVRNVPSDDATESEPFVISVTAAQSDVTTLVSISPTSVTRSTSTTLGVTLTNAVATQYYVILTPNQGEPLEPVFCDWTSATHCDATVNVAVTGAYDVTVQVGSGAGMYNTNTLADALTVTAQQSANATLVSISPTSIVQSVSTVIGVTLTNAPDDELNLMLQPTAGGNPLTFFCTRTSSTHCDATVNVGTTGTYNVYVMVGVGGSAYPTNTLTQTSGLTVTAPPVACVHNECLPGAALGYTCSTCATAVCNSMQACCSSNWTAACVAIAAGHGSCSCTLPGFAAASPLSPNTMASGGSADVTVTMQNEPFSGYTYELLLTPTGGGVTSTHPCINYDDVTHSCLADDVAGLASGPHDAVLAVIAANGQRYVTPALTSAFTVTTPAPACFTGGNVQAPSGMGTCAEPYVIDMSGMQVGATLYHHPTVVGGNASFGETSCDWTGTQQRVVYRLITPPGQGIQVSADAAAFYDTRVAILEDDSTNCFDPQIACGNAGGVGQCDFAEALSGFNSTGFYVIVGTDDDAPSVTARFRTTSGP